MQTIAMAKTQNLNVNESAILEAYRQFELMKKER